LREGASGESRADGTVEGFGSPWLVNLRTRDNRLTDLLSRIVLTKLITHTIPITPNSDFIEPHVPHPLINSLNSWLCERHHQTQSAMTLTAPAPTQSDRISPQGTN
jgi:hypothetical protein